MSLLLLLSGGGPLPRTASDSISSISESPARSSIAFSRSTSETLGLIAEWVTSASSRTRFYLPSGGAAAVNPSFLAWDETAGFDRLRTVVTRSGSVMVSKVRAHTATAAGKTYLSRMYVSDPIAAQTIPSGTVKGTIRVLESAVNDNLDAMQIAIRVVSNDGTTFRSPNIYGPANGTVAEFNTALRAKRLAVGGASSSVVTSAGDRIVIEIATTNTTIGVSLSDTISYGDNATTFLGDNETDTAANNPFLEIDKTITFAATLVRSAGATIPTITESPGKVAAPIRTSADTVGAITANAVAIATPAPPTFTRNAGSGDSIATLVASVVRVATRSLGTSDNLPTLTEAPVKVKILPRTTSAVLATLTEAATRAGGSATNLVRTAFATLAGFVWGQTAWGAGAYGAGGFAESLVRVVTAGIGRTVTDTVATITETVSRLGTFGRTVAQTMGAITEAVARVLAPERIAADALATLSEAVVRGIAALRTVAQTMGSITEAVSWATQAFVRTVAQTMGSITESVASNMRLVADALVTLTEVVGRGASTFGRSVSDTISGITESPNRLGGFLRTTADSLGAVSEAVVRLLSFGRTLAQTLGAITEAVSTSSFAIVRTVADSLPSLSETIARIGGFGRSVAQTLGAIVESIANGSQVVGGVPPVVTSALYSVARGLGYSPTPTGSASGPKPRD